MVGDVHGGRRGGRQVVAPDDGDAVKGRRARHRPQVVDKVLGEAAVPFCLFCLVFVGVGLCLVVGARQTALFVAGMQHQHNLLLPHL